MVKREKMKHYAYSEIEYYRTRIEDPHQCKWENLPFVTKDDIRNHADDIFAPMCIPLLRSKQLFLATTSGSTGKCLEFYWRVEDCKNSLMGLWMKRIQYYHIFPSDKYCVFLTSEASCNMGNTDVFENQKGTCLEFCKSNLNETKLCQIYKRMLEYEPKWLLLQPCIAILLCQVKEKYQLPELESVRYIELTGEMLFEGARKRMKENFHCSIANQYGAIEVNSIAYELPDGKMHIMSDNVYVEIVDDDGAVLPDGEEGNICVTSLHNYAVPFVRYLIGDRGILSTKRDSLGNCNKILELMSGRCNDFVYQPEGKKINPYIFMRAIDNINQMTENAIREFRIIQSEYFKFEVHISVEEEWAPEYIIQQFKENIWQEELVDAEYEFVFEEYLFPDEQKGKVGWFFSRLANE